MPLDASGLTIPTVEELAASIASDQVELIDPAIVTAVDEPMGEVSAIMASHLREVYELAQLAYNSVNPNASEDWLLDALCMLTGTIREREKYSTVILECNLDADFVLPAGARAHVNDHPEIVFETLEDFTADSGTDDYDVPFRAVNPGPVFANAGTIETIATPIPGWNSVTNADDAIPGSDVELDPPLRLRRENELYRPGSSSPDAIRSDLLQSVTDIVQCRVLHNPTNEVDVNGIQPWGVEIIAFGESLNAQELAYYIFHSVAAGTPIQGEHLGSVEDAFGDSHDIPFTFADDRELYLEFDLVVDEELYPGDDLFKAHIVTNGQPFLDIGGSVIAGRLKAIAFAFSGVVDIDALRLGWTSSPVGTSNLTVGLREAAQLSTARIEVAW